MYELRSDVIYQKRRIQSEGLLYDAQRDC